jgi:hypothetical protein
MKVIAEFVRVAWCRVVFGHNMVDLGNNGRGKTTWQCSRCTLTVLHDAQR